MLDMFDSEQLNANSVSTYHNYPLNKPFLNTDWNRNTQQPLSKAFPESNREEIISSLKKLQEKLFQLDSEQKKDQLESTNLIRLINNNNDNLYAAYPINNGTYPVNNSSSYEEAATNRLVYSNNSSINEPYLKHISSIDEKAMNTEKRVLELEKQLEKMRKLIKDDSDSSGNNTSKHYKFSSKSKNKQKSKQIIDIQPISQSVAIESDTTLQDVDPAFSDDSSSFDQQQQQQRSKSCSKKFNNHRLSNKTKQNSVEFDSTANLVYTKSCLKTSSKKTCNLNRSRSADDNQSNNGGHTRSSPSSSHQHFKLNLGEIPFVVGKSTTPSHHLGTNIQNVFSLLKQHHPKLCCKFNSTCNSAKSTNKTSGSRRSRCSGLDNHIEEQLKRSKSTPLVNNNPTIESLMKTTTSSKSSNNNFKESIFESNNNKNDDLIYNVDWNELLRVLQEEYTKLVLHHYDLTKKIINCLDDNKRNGYELKAEYLHRKMKTKAKQINKLKAIQQCKQTSNKNSDEQLFTTTSTQNNNITTKFNNNNNNNSISLSHSIDNNNNNNNKQTFNPKNLKLFKDIKLFQYRFQYD